MITLNDYLYRGDTVLKILHNYSLDLLNDSRKTDNPVDYTHARFLEQIIEILEHNDFLSSQAARIREFYKFLAKNYPFLAFTFKGRLKSLIRSEQKFNGIIVEKIYNHYLKYGCCPSAEEICDGLGMFRDLIAYRIVISMPACHLSPGEDSDEISTRYVYEIANQLPQFFARSGEFEPIKSSPAGNIDSSLLNADVRPYFKDFIANPTAYGYQSLHVTLFDHITNGHVEVQIRTKKMDDNAEIGPANHLGYEKRQENTRAQRRLIPEGESLYFDEAIERGKLLQNIELKDINVNMFGAVNNSLINDGCGLYRGRLITPYEHLSRFQNDAID